MSIETTKFLKDFGFDELPYNRYMYVDNERKLIVLLHIDHSNTINTLVTVNNTYENDLSEQTFDNSIDDIIGFLLNIYTR